MSSKSVKKGPEEKAKEAKNEAHKAPWGVLKIKPFKAKGAKKMKSEKPVKLYKSSVLIGRKRGADITREEKTVSREHCVIHNVKLPNGQRKAVIQRLSKKNDLWVNYTKLENDGSVKCLEHEDKIALGRKVVCTFEYIGFHSENHTPRSPGGKRPKHHHKPHHFTLQKGMVLSPAAKEESIEADPEWEVLGIIGQGTFSEIYKARGKSSNLVVAVKVEKQGIHHNVLNKEIDIMKDLQRAKNYVCRYYGHGPLPGNDKGSFVLMELCHINVSEYRKKQKHQKFSAYEGGYLAREMLRALKAVHKCGYIHRDIKPSNFMLPKNRTGFECYIVDFGLSKRHILEDGKVVKPRERTEFRGTSLYASVFTHELKELGRRDDIWSLLFVIIDCINGGLPWRACKDKRTQVFAEKKKYCGQNRLPKKESLQEPLREFMRLLHKLEYADEPDYDSLEKCLEQLAEEDEEGKKEYLARKESAKK
mmetsp:Transcript_16097/g.24273  ORF Transcript_16097/g.24273 Transcript_16097/m.24273 type:complete len:476 (+) Transcript_16097:41-1468(+)